MGRHSYNTGHCLDESPAEFPKLSRIPSKTFLKSLENILGISQKHSTNLTTTIGGARVAVEARRYLVSCIVCCHMIQDLHFPRFFYFREPPQ